jgi:hypothetical protein
MCEMDALGPFAVATSGLGDDRYDGDGQSHGHVLEDHFAEFLPYPSVWHTDREGT